VHSHKHLHFLDADGNTENTEESARARVCVCSCMHVWHALVLTGGCFTAEGSSTLVFISLQLLR